LAVPVLPDGDEYVQALAPCYLTLISPRYEPVPFTCNYPPEQHYRLVPPPCQHKYVCKCGEEKP
jgi:hypothetical protein